MKKILVSLLIWGTMEQAAFAAGSCPNPVYHLLGGQPAPCEGFLFTPAKEQEVRETVENYQLLQDEFDLENKQLQLYKAQIGDFNTALATEKKETALWKTNADTSLQKYVALEDREGTRDIVFTLLGVVLTVASAYAMRAASK